MRLDFSDVPAGINQDDELVPQCGIAYSQVDLPKWTLMIPDDPIMITKHSLTFNSVFHDSCREVRSQHIKDVKKTCGQNKTIDSLWIRGSVCQVKTRRCDGVFRQQAVGVKPTHVFGRRWTPGFRSQEGATAVSWIAFIKAILEISRLGRISGLGSRGGVGGKRWRGGCSDGRSGFRCGTSFCGLWSLFGLWRWIEDNLRWWLFQSKNLS